MTDSTGFQMATTIDRSKIKDNSQVFGGQVFYNYVGTVDTIKELCI